MKIPSLILLLVTVASASAITITSPLTLQQQYVAGYLSGQPGDSSIPTEQTIAQHILDLTLGQVDGSFAANTVYDYSGTITSNGGQHDGTSIPAGWGGALAKYDGPNGGYVLFLFGGEASTIPQYPYDFFTTNHEQYALSHYTLFSGTGGLTPTPFGVPEGGSGIALLGMALLGLEGVRRLVSRRALA